MKSRLIDAGLGLLISLAVAGAYVLQRGFLESLELRYYDLRMSLTTADVDVPSDIVIIAVDEDSLARLGRWPWSRTVIANMLEKLGDAQPRVIGLDVIFSEKSDNPAFAELDALEKKFTDLVAARKIVQRGGANFQLEFSSAAHRLDTDAHLTAALENTPNVVLPMYFKTGGATGGHPPTPPSALSKSALSVQMKAMPEGAAPPLEATRVTYPLESFLDASTGTGHVSIFPDQDGIVRRESPVIKYGDEYYPSYAVQLVAKSMGLTSGEIDVTPGESILVGNMEIPLDETQSMLITYNGGARTFRYFKFYEVLASDFDMSVFKDKIVIIGPSAPGIATLNVTPLSVGLPSVEYIANVAENIVNNRYITRPEWAVNAELGALGLIGLFIMLVLPRLGVVSGLFLSMLLMGGMLGAGFYVFQQDSYWVKVVYPSFLLGVGYFVIVLKNFFTTEQDKERVEGTQADTNKQLGLQFQQQGMLDLAFEKLRTCPLDENMKETLYNLSLDFERKRQYAKAVSVYEYIGKEDSGYKDIAKKIETLKAAAEGAVFGGIGGGASKEGTIFAGGGASKPTLGRYEIEKELGRGAMGIVYLGKDPKINRQVAIKTLMMEGDDDPKETKEIKERFFREAESAGTLNHPTIVRIFDAGEDQDLCWIAMELLDGHDFVRYTKKETLMPAEQAMEYIAKVADALDYANSQGIVHRDIKPANLMLLKDNSVRVTDFGIARITASSKTATGTVMGTPSYMSPDQVAGKKVDGRSDLFSLGVTLYELLCGEKPFKGGEGIGTLLFQIANDPEPDILKVNPNLPASIKDVIHRALMKKAEERYQSGAQMAKDIRACLAEMGGGAKATLSEAPAKAPAVHVAPVQSDVADSAAEDIAGSLIMPGEGGAAAPEESTAIESPPAAEQTAAGAPPTEQGGIDLDMGAGSFSNDLGSIAGSSAPAEPVLEATPEPVQEPPVDLSAATPEAAPAEAPSPSLLEDAPSRGLGSAQSLEINLDLGAPPAAEPIASAEEPVSEPVREPAPEPAIEPAPDADETVVLPAGGLSFDMPAASAELAPEPVLEPAPEPAPEPVPEPVLEPAPEPAIEPAPDADETVVLPAGGLSFDMPAARAEFAPEPVLEPAPEPVLESAPEPTIEPDTASMPTADETMVLPAGGLSFDMPAASAEPAPPVESELPPEEFSSDETLVLPAGTSGFTPTQVAESLPTPPQEPPADPNTTISLDDEIEKAKMDETL